MLSATKFRTNFTKVLSPARSTFNKQIREYTSSAELEHKPVEIKSPPKNGKL
jgi:hypothetical protein